ncbi:MAG TPA: hypothetical protein DDW94_09350 [Deltaproteobacteria bacterium]|nr:MAG: hypothetical protein A2Z79_03845 [Deltaproteobacteria bacterium GWA2_55_82]OGQ64063.1 MAG: hypothetical protein A3I81_10220 [Deltaproteobacteria bacterium RIFCSPLOWO2_02_FULL_55_12]OIJ74513.1 MAG: hypothetical protein A2V21_309745 [Deltaproteobacteria bacterium GWC2_55_46]HBG47176.1 hypothetical protein [Deltaproteobacteria bacterium]HCY10762.1 hypothetical protein [Deltaproteobacteria bacterium]
MSKEGSLSLDRQGRIIRFSQRLEDMLGYDAEDVLGREFTSLAPSGMEDVFLSILDGAEGQSGTPPKKAAFLCKGGTVAEFYLLTHPLRDRSGEIYSYLLALSVRKTAMPAFLSDEFRRMFKFSNDAVSVTDRDGSIIDVNQAFQETYGYERHEVLGRNPRVLKSSHSTKALYEKMWKDILDPAVGYWRGEIINLAKDGREVPVLLSINAIKDARGDIKCFLGIAFNMTRQKELDKLRKMYIDHIIHDIRGPLTSITVNAELLLMLPALSDTVKRKLKVISSSALKIGSMTSDILDYSRAENASVMLRKERVSVAEAICEAAMPFEGAGKLLLFMGEPSVGPAFEGMEVFADSDKLKRVIYNLLSNAFKHAATKVEVAAEVVPAGLSLSVSNDGKGISSEQAERIFEAFYQTEDGVKTGGAGLGLSIVKSFVEAHGGRVWVRAGEENGVTFGFLIPSEPAAL